MSTPVEELLHHPVNVNTAGLDSLRAVRGLDDVLAGRIIVYRAAHGPFERIEDLALVRGIGPRTLEKMRDQITLNAANGSEAGETAVASAAASMPSSQVPEDEKGSAMTEQEQLPSQEAEEPEASDTFAEVIEAASEDAAAEIEAVAAAVTEPEAVDVVEDEAEAIAEETSFEDMYAAEPQHQALIADEVAEAPDLDEDATFEEVYSAEPQHEALVSDDGWDDEDELIEEDTLDAIAEDIAEGWGEDELAEGEEVAYADLGAQEPEYAGYAAGAEDDELVDEPEEVEEEAAPVVAAAAPVSEPPAPQTVVVKPSFWHNFWMVLLGGLLGVLLTIAAVIIWSGTVDFAPRRQVDALSRNMQTMQSNQEMTWERVDELSIRADQIQRQVNRLEPLVEQVDGLEGDIGALRDDLKTVDDVLVTVAEQMEGLDQEIGSLGERVNGTELAIDEVDKAVDKVRDDLVVAEQAIDKVEGRITSFDAFFGALRDLLIDLEGAPPPAVDEDAKAMDDAEGQTKDVEEEAPAEATEEPAEEAEEAAGEAAEPTPLPKEKE